MHGLMLTPHPTRSPVYDVRELTGVEDDTGSMVGSLEREKGVLVDDLRWQGELPHYTVLDINKGKEILSFTTTINISCTK